MHSRRALLYIPGDDRRKIEKSTTLGVDSICMDLEDGVAINRKVEARAVIAQAMKELEFGTSERCVRINSIGSGLESYDLVAALSTNPDTIVVPKIDNPDHVLEVAVVFDGMPVRLIPHIETARSLLAAAAIAARIQPLSDGSITSRITMS